MPEHLGDSLGVDVAGRELGSARVSEAVEADLRKPTQRAFEEPSEGAVSEVGGVDNRRVVGEDEAGGPVEVAYPLHLLELTGEMGAKGLDGGGRELNSAAAPFGLWLA